jgi:hypothetical protein
VITSTSVAVATPTVSNPTDSVPVTTAGPVVPPVEQGTLFSKLLAPAAPAGQPASVTVDVPPGTTFQLTDIALQNPDRDAGVAVLMNGSDVVYQFALADVLGDKRVSWVSPIEVQGGTALVFQVTCSTTGSATGNCTTSMLVSGRMVPATAVSG